MKKTFYVVLLDYSAPSVNHYSGVEILSSQEVDDTDLIEGWLAQNTEHHLSNCSWMASEDEIEIFNN